MCLLGYPTSPFFAGINYLKYPLHFAKLICVFFFFCFFGPHPQPMEVLGLGVELEIQQLVYTTVTVMDLDLEPCLRPTPQVTAMLDP